MRDRHPLVAVVCAVVCALGALALTASVTFGQTVNVTYGGINGRVADSTGGVLPGATVMVTNLDTGLKREVVTEGDGSYAINLLPPGRYQVDAELIGIGKARLPLVEVLLGNATLADLTITPRLSETITVTATMPVVDTSRTGTAVSVTNQQIENLPLLGRDFRSLASLTPGIVDTFGSRISANGARGIATDYNIDGASSNNDFFGENTGGTRAPFTFSQAAIREFQVVRSQYDAEYGRGVGAQINAITKSGTNNFSGEAFLFRRQRSWADTRPLTLSNGQTVVDSFRARDSTQPGFAIGGPIVRNKLFFFGNFDAQRQKLPITITGVPQMSTFLALAPDVQQAFLAKVQRFLGTPYADELNYDQTFDQNSYLMKVDANVSQKLRFSVRDNYTNFENAYNLGSRHRSNQGIEHDRFNQFVAQGTYVVSNRTVNEMMVSNTRDERPVTPLGSGTEISVSGAGTSAIFLGQADTLPNNTKETKTQVKDTIQLMAGRHTFKAGTDLLFMHIDNLFASNLNGVFLYSTVQAYLDDTVNSYRQGYGPGRGLTAWNQNTYAFFATDNYRVNRRLTLDLGLRYDWQTMPLPAGNAFPQHPEFISQFTEDKNNVAPRIGFAYDLTGNGRSVLRGGTGLFYGYMPDILLSNPLTQISGNFNQVTITCATATTVRCPTFPNLLSPDQFGILARTATDIVTVASDYQAQQAARGSVQFERQIGAGYTAAVGGIFSKMTKVQGSRNVNAVPTGVSLGGVKVYDIVSATRKYTDMGVVRELCSCEEASFKSLTLETHKLAGRDSKISWDLSYTFSSAIDQDSNERSTSTSFLFDPSNPALNNGPSDNDIRHRIVGDASYQLPWGIMASGIVQWRTGVPYNGGIAFTGVGTTATSLNGLSQTTGNIPVFVDSGGNVIDLTLANNFSRQQFADFLSGQNAKIIGRNAFRQPRWFTADLRLSKTFHLPGNTRVQILGEAFNILNTKDHLVGSTNTNAFRATYTAATDRYTFTKFTTFGLTSSYATTPDPRQYQVALKLMF